MLDPTTHPHDPRNRRRFPHRFPPRLFLWGGLLIWILLGLSGALAQEPDAETAPQETPETSETAELPEAARELATRIESDYEVLPVRGGLVLRPRAEDAPFRALEIGDEGLALDGEPVDEEGLRERLGDAAEPVLRLAAMEPAERDRLLGLAAAPEPAVEAEAPEGGAPDVEAPEPPEEAVEVPERPRMRTGDKVSLVGGVTIKEDEIAKEVVVVAGPLRVKGVVDGGAVVVGGSAYIDGEVRRELMVVGGNVYLGPDSLVDGDINIMAGGRVHREPGAEVTGRINELGVVGPVFGDGDDLDFDIDFRPRFRPLRWFSGVMGAFFWLVTLALLACLVVLFGQRAVEGVEETLAADPWRSGAVGLVFQLLFLPLLVIVVLLLVLSIIGIPLLLLLPFALLGLLLAGFVGYVAVALLLGRKVLARFERRAAGPYLPVVLGVMVIGIWGVFSEALDLPYLGWLSGLVLAVGVLVCYAAWTFGGGALLLRVISRRRERRVGGPPAPPPAPPETTPPETPEPEPAPEPTGAEEPPEASPTPDDAEEPPEPEEPEEPPEPNEPK